MSISSTHGLLIKWLRCARFTSFDKKIDNVYDWRALLSSRLLFGILFAPLLIVLINAAPPFFTHGTGSEDVVHSQAWHCFLLFNQGIEITDGAVLQTGH